MGDGAFPAQLSNPAQTDGALIASRSVMPPAKRPARNTSSPLHAFIAANRDEIIARTSQRVGNRTWPSDAPKRIEHGLPLFLTQLSETLRLEMSESPFPTSAIGSSAAQHGRELLAEGYTVSQVVHDYGDICQAITELALDRKAPITVKEFHTLNRCLDTAIAEAITEYARVRAGAA